jgi:hypothetical protein
MSGWHVAHDGPTLTVSRRSDPHWDLSVTEQLPEVGSPARLAHQIRQDLWRRLRRLRGFCPAVQVTRCDGHSEVRAGGGVAGAFPRAASEAAIAELLACPRHRARWLAHAGSMTHA